MLHALVVAVGCAAFLPIAQEKSQTWRLEFQPPKGKVLEVAYRLDTSWDYRKSTRRPLEMWGTLRTKQTLRWKFEAQPRGWLASGRFTHVEYGGKGSKKGTPFDYDVVWRKADGFVKGGDSKAVKSWLHDEVKETVRFIIDERVAASPGEC